MQSILHLPVPMLTHHPFGYIAQEGDVQLMNPSKGQNFFPSWCFPHWAPLTASMVLCWPNNGCWFACSLSTKWSRWLPETTPLFNTPFSLQVVQKNFNPTCMFSSRWLTEVLNSTVRTWHCKNETHLSVTSLNLLLHLISLAKQLLNHYTYAVILLY